jgi:adenosylcobinamide-GDP ribazoletransferase
MTRFLAAIQFLTIVPVRIRRTLTPEDMAGSMLFFPVVGILLGFVIAALGYLGLRIFPPFAVSLLLVAVLTGLTGGLHVDGLADTADVILSGRSPEVKLQIMKDPHIGAMGVTAIVFAVALKAVFMSCLPGKIFLPALVVLPCAGRCAMILPAWLFPYARKEGGTAEPFVRHLNLKIVLPALFISAAAVFFLSRSSGVLALAAAILFSLLAVAAAARSIGGVTGDTLGAANETAEIVFLAALSAISPHMEAA